MLVKSLSVCAIQTHFHGCASGQPCSLPVHTTQLAPLHLEDLCKPSCLRCPADAQPCLTGRKVLVWETLKLQLWGTGLPSHCITSKESCGHPLAALLRAEAMLRDQCLSRVYFFQGRLWWRGMAAECYICSCRNGKNALAFPLTRKCWLYIEHRWQRPN